jgi:meiosis-specific APC/C activator protein AMA1
MALTAPTPSRSRLSNKVYGSPTCLGLTDNDLLDLTPADSGYGSSFVTPKRLIMQLDSPLYSHKYGRFPYWDGNGSPDNPSTSSNDTDSDDGKVFNDDGDVFTDTKTDTFGDVITAAPAKDMGPPPKKRLRSATLPHRGPLSGRPTLPTSFYSEGSLRSTKAGSGVRARRLKDHSLRIPDRFIPLRDSIVPISDMFRVTKPAAKLSSAEKLRRDRTATPDPFVFRRPLVSPMAPGHRLHTRSDTRAVRNGGSCQDRHPSAFVSS